MADLPPNTAPIDTEQDAAGAPSPPDSPAVGRNSPAAAPKGPLLTLAPDAAAREAERLWKLNPWFHKLHAGECLQHLKWRKGERFVKLAAKHDSGTVEIVTPIGLDDLPPTPNKVEEQVRNVVATVMADPPKPECEPSADDAPARDAAQFATRFLVAQSGESGLNIDQVLYSALDLAATYRSSFVLVDHDPYAGGYVPLTIKARPSARSVATAETGELPSGPDTGPWVTKYVGAGGALSDSPAGAQMTWESGLVLDTFTSNQVRFLPRLTRGIETAEGAVLAYFLPFGTAKRRWKALGAMQGEDLAAVLSWRVSDYRRLLPDDYDRTAFRASSGDTTGQPDTADGVKDDTLICVLRVLYKSTPAYPKGCDAVFVGGKFRVQAAPLYFENADGAPEAMDLPLAQCRWEVDADGGNPYGETSVRRMGPLDEQRTAILTHLHEYFARFVRPRLMLPMGSTVQPEDWADWDKVITYNPNGKPELGQLPQLPPIGMDLIQLLDADLSAIAGVAGPAMGQVAGSVRSAEQQNTLIERATVAITQVRENAKDFYERLHRLILQAARRWFTEPQLMTYRRDDGAYQVQEFTRADFGSTKQVRVQRNTFTMLTPTAKNEVIAGEQQMGAIDPLEAARLRRENISAMVGLQDNPHLLRVKRQLATWRKGPSEEQQAQAAQMAQQMAMQPPPEPQLDPASGQMVPPPPPPDPLQQMGSACFPPLPVDEEPPVAAIRHQELSKALPEIEQYGYPPGWNQALLAAYDAARRAAGIVTLAEQQQAQMQQQQAQAAQAQQQEAQKQQGAAQKQEKDQQFKLSQQAQSDQAAQERELQRMAMQATAGAP